MVRVTKEISIELKLVLNGFTWGEHKGYEVIQDGVPNNAEIEKTEIDGEYLKITFSYTPETYICPIIRTIYPKHSQV